MISIWCKRLISSTTRAKQQWLSTGIPRDLLLVPVALIIFSGIGCAAGGKQESGDNEPSALTGGSACFYVRDASSWTVLDRSTLIVYAPNKSSAFRVQVSPGASDLRWADSLAFVSRSNRICGRAGERIVVPTGGAKSSYSVIDVRRLNSASLEGLLAEHGKAGRSEPVEPGESPGADIERELGTAKAESGDDEVVPVENDQSENQNNKDQ